MGFDDNYHLQNGDTFTNIHNFSINLINPIALIMAKTLQSFGCSECNRVTGPEGNAVF